jgi:hypothetical protein
MDYFKGILSGLAAILIADFACLWPLLRGSKATGLAAVAGSFVEGIFSLKFWVVGVLLFGVFFAASRSGTILRVLFFWIPTLAVSAMGFAFVAMWTYLYMRFMRQ